MHARMGKKAANHVRAGLLKFEQRLYHPADQDYDAGDLWIRLGTALARTIARGQSSAPSNDGVRERSEEDFAARAPDEGLSYEMQLVVLWCALRMRLVDWR